MRSSAQDRLGRRPTTPPPHHPTTPLPHYPSTIPRHSPNPIRAYPARSHHPLMITSSPSSRKARSSPLGRRSFSFPPLVRSSKQPRLSGVGPLIVPVPRTSPGRRLQPFEA